MKRRITEDSNEDYCHGKQPSPVLLLFHANSAALVGHSGMSDLTRPVVRLFMGEHCADDRLAAWRYRWTIFRDRRDTPLPGARCGQISATCAVRAAVTGIK